MLVAGNISATVRVRISDTTACVGVYLITINLCKKGVTKMSQEKQRETVLSKRIDSLAEGYESLQRDVDSLMGKHEVSKKKKLSLNTGGSSPASKLNFPEIKFEMSNPCLDTEISAHYTGSLVDNVLVNGLRVRYSNDSAFQIEAYLMGENDKLETPRIEVFHNFDGYVKGYPLFCHMDNYYIPRDLCNRFLNHIRECNSLSGVLDGATSVEYIPSPKRRETLICDVVELDDSNNEQPMYMRCRRLIEPTSYHIVSWRVENET